MGTAEGQERDSAGSLLPNSSNPPVFSLEKAPCTSYNKSGQQTDPARRRRSCRRGSSRHAPCTLLATERDSPQAPPRCGPGRGVGAGGVAKLRTWTVASQFTELGLRPAPHTCVGIPRNPFSKKALGSS